MVTKCDPKFQVELDRTNSEIAIEDDLAFYSEIVEMRELIDNARLRGETYGIGFEDGFGLALKFDTQKRILRIESIRQKHQELKGHWGLE